MLDARHLVPFRLLALLATSFGVWSGCGAASAAAATCGDYLHTRNDGAHNGRDGNLIADTTKSADGASRPFVPCQGPRCGEVPPMAPANFPPPVRSVRTNELVHFCRTELDFTSLPALRQSVIESEPAGGYPSRIKRPPRRWACLLS